MAYDFDTFWRAANARLDECKRAHEQAQRDVIDAKAALRQKLTALERATHELKEIKAAYVVGPHGPRAHILFSGPESGDA